MHIRKNEGNVLFNTFYLRLYVITHMVKDHSDSKRENPLPPHGLLFPISSKASLYAPSHRQDSTYHGLCYTSHGALARTRYVCTYEYTNILTHMETYTYISYTGIH